MDIGKLDQGDRMSALGAIALFFIMLLFPWFGVDLPAGMREFTEGLGGDLSLNAFDAFEGIDLILLLTVIVAAGLAFAKATGRKVKLPVSASALTAGLGILSVVLILYSILDPPGPGMAALGRKMGVYLGLLAAGAIAYGGWISMKAEGTTFGGEAERIQDRFDSPDEGAAGGGGSDEGGGEGGKPA